MGFDAIILSATTTALYRHGSSQSGLWNLLFRDGLVYFLVTASCNSVPVVGFSFRCLVLEQILIFFPRFSTFCSSIVSARILTRLNTILKFYYRCDEHVGEFPSLRAEAYPDFSIATVPAATIAFVIIKSPWRYCI